MALPNEEERESIWRIHLGKVGQTKGLNDEGMKRLAASSEGFSGAEIEQAVHDSMYDNYKDGEILKLDVGMVEASLKLMTPLAQARRVALSRLSKWAEANARHASMSQKEFRANMREKSQPTDDDIGDGIVL